MFAVLVAAGSILIMDFAVALSEHNTLGSIMTRWVVLAASVVSFVVVAGVGILLEAACVTSELVWGIGTVVLPAAIGVATALMVVRRRRRSGRTREP
jgi:hypothetical protein